jgi:hypothetical protein
VSGTVTPASSPVGGSLIWRLQVRNAGDGMAADAVLDVQLSPNAAFGLAEVERGSGCVADGQSLHCGLDVLKAAGDPLSTNEIVIATNVTAPGEVSLTATAAFAAPDPTPEDNTLALKANVLAAAVPREALAQPPARRAVRPVLGKAVGSPGKPRAGKRFTFSLPVTRSDTHARLLTGKLVCNPSVAGKRVRHAESFKAGKVRLSLVVPATARGKLLKVKITVIALGHTARHTYAFAVR